MFLTATTEINKINIFQKWIKINRYNGTVVMIVQKNFLQ